MINVSKIKYLGCDIDGVLRNFVQSAARWYQKDFPDKVIDLTNIEYEMWMRNLPFADQETWYNWFSVERAYEVFGTANELIFGQMAKFNQFLRNAERSGIDVVLISNLYHKAIPATYHWLGRTGCMVEKIIVVSSSEEKSQYVDAMVDDNVKVLLACKEKGCIPIRYVQPWNEELAGDVDMLHINNIDGDLYEALQIEKEIP